MKSLTKLSWVLAVGATLLGGTTGLLAGNTVGGRTTPPTAATAGEVTSLQSAYHTLLGADHDYQGHRAKAMHEIAEACRLLGTPIVAPGRGSTRHTEVTPVKHATTEPEQQSTSDQQLQQAQATVKQVLGGIPTGTQPRVVERLNAAVTEIGVALSVK